MKKTAVISIFRTGNYGATLQAYALKQAIQEHQAGQAEIVNYCCDAIKGKINYNYLKKAGLKNTIAAIVDKICYLPRMRKVNRFVDSYVTGPELTREQLPSLNSRYDFFLTGSDQIWNPDIQQGDYSYLLDFVEDDYKKRSYGSSFGIKELPEACRATYRELLSEYECITVRENTGADIVEALLGRRPQIVLDPVFLLTREEWERLLPERIYQKDYIFTYRMSYSKIITSVARRVQKETGYPIMASPFLIGYTPETRMYMGLSSLEWVRAIYDSSFVITDSFHGVVFALIFSKPFYYVVTTDHIKSRLSRLETLLGRLGIEGRIISSPEECDLKASMDYGRIQGMLQEEREKSIQILRRMLEQGASL